jgi:hypothetical protein
MTARSSDAGDSFKFIMDVDDGATKHRNKCMMSADGLGRVDLDLYEETLFSRIYSIPKLADDVTPPNKSIISITQFSNQEFSLCDIDGDDVSYVVANTGEAVSEKYEIGLYGGRTDDSPAQLTNQVEAGVVDAATASMFPLDSAAYGFDCGGGVYGLFVNNAADKIVYGSGSTTAKRNYMFEYTISPPEANDARAYGYSDGDSYGLFVDNVDRKTVYGSNESEKDSLAYNFTPTKNLYDNDWGIKLDPQSKLINTFRQYYGIGTSNNTLWLKYKVYSDWASVARGGGTASMHDYEQIERIKGLYKLKNEEGHKSNVFNIKVKNSGLGGIFDSGGEEKLKNSIKSTIKRFMEKVAPVNTQIWQVQFEN